jgi:hypothetical protein
MTAKLKTIGLTFADVTIVLVVIAYIFSVLRWMPIALGFQLGSDEGFELMKAYLCTKDFRLYTDIWCDQPPIHTALLVTGFRLFGSPSVYVARVTTILCTGLLLLSYYSLIRALNFSMLISMLAIFFFLLSPDVLRLSVASMMIMPGLAFTVLTAAFAAYYVKTGRLSWLLISGTSFGIANQTKLTAFLIAPALIYEIVRSTRAKARSINLAIFAWAIPAVSVTAGIVIYYHEFNIGMLLGTHFSAKTYSAFDASIERAKVHSMLNSQLPVLLAAAVGCVNLLLTERKAFFPIILFVTTYAFHLIHRPFWSFYATHFALSLSWLAAVGVVDIVRRASNHIQGDKMFLRMYGLTLLPLFSLLFIVDLPQRAQRELFAALATHNVDEDAIVKQLRALANPGDFIVTDNVLYAFHAGLLVDPSLAVPSEKRLASGQLDVLNYVRCLKDPRSRAALLRRPISPEIQTELNQHYVIYDRSETCDLYVRRGERDSLAESFSPRDSAAQRVKDTSQ